MPSKSAQIVLGWQPREFGRANNVFYFTDRVYTLLRYLLSCRARLAPVPGGGRRGGERRRGRRRGRGRRGRRRRRGPRRGGVALRGAAAPLAGGALLRGSAVWVSRGAARRRRAPAAHTGHAPQ